MKKKADGGGTSRVSPVTYIDHALSLSLQKTKTYYTHSSSLSLSLAEYPTLRQRAVSILPRKMSSPYPNIYQIEEIFSNRDTPSVFNAHLADHVDVTVVGKDFHISGNYKSKQAFHEEIFARVAAALKEETIRTEVVRVIGRGDSAWAAVESLATATSKYGESDRSSTRELLHAYSFCNGNFIPLRLIRGRGLFRHALPCGVCGLGAVRLAGEDRADEGVL